jgi:hypothetical protein
MGANALCSEDSASRLNGVIVRLERKRLQSIRMPGKLEEIRVSGRKISTNSSAYADSRDNRGVPILETEAGQSNASSYDQRWER